MKTKKGKPCQSPLIEIAKAYHATQSSRGFKSKFASVALKSLSARPLSACLPTALEAATSRLFFSRPHNVSRQRKTESQILRARAGGKLYPKPDRLDHARAARALRDLTTAQRYHACPS